MFQFKYKNLYCLILTVNYVKIYYPFVPFTQKISTKCIFYIQNIRFVIRTRKSFSLILNSYFLHKKFFI